jgi:hypothetical protein
MPRKTRAETRGPLLAEASSPNAIRARIRLIGLERDLPSMEVESALKANTQLADEDNAILKLACKHNINMSWLLTGDLRGLRSMGRMF